MLTKLTVTVAYEALRGVPFVMDFAWLSAVNSIVVNESLLAWLPFVVFTSFLTLVRTTVAYVVTGAARP